VSDAMTRVDSEAVPAFSAERASRAGHSFDVSAHGCHPSQVG
jgi:hypothetical protein